MDPTQPLELNYELVIWGEGDGDVKKRFNDIRCIIELSEQETTELRPQLTKIEKKKAFYSVIIPIHMIGNRENLKYLFRFKLDGVENATKWFSVPIKGRKLNANNLSVPSSH